MGNKLVEAYFKNDESSVLGALSAGQDMGALSTLLERANYSLEARQATGVSELAGIQKQMMDMYLNESTLEHFREHVVSHPEMLSTHVKYPGLASVGEVLNSKIAGLESQKKVM